VRAQTRNGCDHDSCEHCSFKEDVDLDVDYEEGRNWHHLQLDGKEDQHNQRGIAVAKEEGCNRISVAITIASGSGITRGVSLAVTVPGNDPPVTSGLLEV
jgi:hypothetical protein